MSLFPLILLGCSNSVERPEPEIRVVTRIERATPPADLVRQCVAAADREITVTRDIVDDRNAWRSAFCSCAAQHSRLSQWNTDIAPEPIRGCT